MGILAFSTVAVPYGWRQCDRGFHGELAGNQGIHGRRKVSAIKVEGRLLPLWMKHFTRNILEFKLNCQICYHKDRSSNTARDEFTARAGNNEP